MQSRSSTASSSEHRGLPLPCLELASEKVRLPRWRGVSEGLDIASRENSSADARKTSALLALTLAALFLSGIASVANQVVWQRGLKVFLGGSESLSSMIVVLVFMLGLGLGAGCMGARAGRIRRPMRAFASIELALSGVNLGIAALLAMDVGHVVFAAERFVLVLGVPLRVVYALGALAVLFPPTLLMGATLPIASETCQRQLGASRNSLIVILFLLNTLGAVVGAFGSSFLLLPWFGQWISLLAAASMNLVAGALLWLGSASAPAAVAAVRVRDRGVGLRRGLRIEEVLGFGLGFFSLGYEMYLFRLMSLAHKPLPTTFATTLCLYLLFWSLGVFLASYLRERLRITFCAGALLVASMPSVYHYDRFEVGFSIFAGGLLYFLPCVCFGLLYGVLVSRSAQAWGYDVGRFYLLNTLGSCLGILFLTLAGYEIQHDFNAYLIAGGLLGLLSILIATESELSAARRLAVNVVQAGLLVGLVALLASCWMIPRSSGPGGVSYWGRDGVVEVRDGGEVWIDGLMHTRLSNGRSHIGGRYSWLMAVSAVFAHRDLPLRKALVVGNGVGITAGTLAKLPGLSVVAYEINHTLADLFADSPKGTLGVANNPRIDIRWQDARSGLALDESRYDLIVSAPLYLRQAGSSLLLSREYMELVKSRLNEDGVFALYSREGDPLQALLVQRTVRSVFPYVQALNDGQTSVASRVPIEITRHSIQQRLGRKNPFYREVARYDEVLRSRRQSLYDILSPRSVDLEPGALVITDDHPLVEYPSVVARLVDPGGAFDGP